MFDAAALSTALLLGFFSSTHCIGMCGGIMGALTLAVSNDQPFRRMAILLSYNLGRLASYTLMGAIAGYFGYWLVAAGAGQWLRVLAAALLVAMALYLANWWRGLTRLEALGQGLWSRIQPLGRRLLPVQNVGQGLVLGALWGWLPCGLVYTALSYAMTQPGAASGALVMLAFGIGTLPAVLATGVAAAPLLRLARRPWFRQLCALLLLIFAGWTLYGALAGHHAGHVSRADSTMPAGHHQHH